MNKIVDNIQSHLVYLFFLIPFLPTFMVIDRMTVSFFYFGIVCILIQFLFLLRNQVLLSVNFFKERPLLIFYGTFLLWQIVTLFGAFNLIEGLIEFIQYLTLFNVLILISHFGKSYQKIDVFLFLILLLGIIETSVSFSVFIENYSFENGIQRIRELQGLSSNQNFTSFAILFKIPIIFYFYFKTNNKFIASLLLFFLGLMTFMLLVLASRASIYGYILILLLTSIFVFFQKGLTKERIIRPLKVFFILGVSVLSFLTQDFLYSDSNKFNIKNRISDLSDNSTNMRLLNYKEAFYGMLDNPLIGVGIGNWKIISLKYAQNRIESYQVPKHTHNDFLQIGAETGVIGLILYLSIFFSILMTSINFLLHESNKDVALLLFFFLIVYSIDSFFNFPRIRPYSQLNFFVIAFVYSWLKNTSINDE